MTDDGPDWLDDMDVSGHVGAGVQGLNPHSRKGVRFRVPPRAPKTLGEAGITHTECCHQHLDRRSARVDVSDAYDRTVARDNKPRFLDLAVDAIDHGAKHRCASPTSSRSPLRDTPWCSGPPEPYERDGQGDAEGQVEQGVGGVPEHE